MAIKLILGLVLARFCPNSIPKFFLWVLPLLDVIHCCKLSLHVISRKPNEPNLKPSFGPTFAPFYSNLGPRKFFMYILLLLDNKHCCKLSFHAIWRKTKEPNLRKWQKTKFRARFWSIWPIFRLPKLFFKNLAVSH